MTKFWFFSAARHQGTPWTFFKSSFLTYEISGFQILRGLLDPSGLRLAART